MSSGSASPETKGHRALIETLFHWAEKTPDRIFGSFAKAKNVADGFHDFTFKELAHAVDACSWHIKESYGQSKTFEPILYLGVNDYRYCIVLFAAIKCGYKALFVNPRYPLENITTLMENTGCSKILYSPELLPTVEQLLLHDPRNQAKELAPPLHWLKADSASFPYTKNYEQSKHDPVLVLHSSGTTGAPKPITYTNAWFAMQDMEWPDVNGRPGGNMILLEAFNGGYTYSQYPQCHFGGVLYTTLRPLFTLTAASVLGFPGSEIDNAAALALDIIRVKSTKAIAATPLLLETIVSLPGGIDALTELNVVSFAGGPLRSDLGDQLTKRGVTLLSSYGLTELGSCPVVLSTPEDWQWTQFHPDVRASLEPTQDGEGTHELVFKDEGEVINQRRATFWSLGTAEYRTKDLFIQHPSNPSLWKYHSRTDDILVLDNAGKINPIPIENAIASHLGVSGVLVAGAHRWPACILVEPSEQGVIESDFMRRISPTIEAANDSLREDLRIPLDMVAVLPAGALVRGIKGQIMRKQSAEKYEATIDRLYAKRLNGHKADGSH